MSLFEDISRNDGDAAGYSESLFDFLNHSPWKASGEARSILDQWFGRIPEDHQNDIKGRFRDDDREHSGVMLELLTHEALLRACADVEFTLTSEPCALTLEHDLVSKVHYGMYCNARSHSQYPKAMMRRRVLDTIDSLDISPFKVLCRAYEWY